MTDEAEGFTEARSAERVRVGEGVTPSRWWGSGGSPPGNFGKFASKSCLLSAFRGYLCTYLQLKIYMKNVSHYKHIVSKIPLVFKFKMKQFFVLYYESDFTVIPFDSLL